jgi:hypothetical protein
MRDGERRRPCSRRGATCVLQRKVAHVSVPTPPQEQSWPGLRAEIRPSLINSHRTHLDLKRVMRTHQRKPYGFQTPNNLARPPWFGLDATVHIAATDLRAHNVEPQVLSL